MDEDDLVEELRRGVADGPEPPVAKKVSAPRRRERRGIPPWLMIGGVFVLLSGAVAFLLWGTEASDAFVYSKLVDEVMASPEEFRDRELRVEGQLQEGSVEFDAEPECEHRFVLTREGYEMPVRFPRCVVPDTFRDDMPMDVVVQGQLQSNGTFLASQVIPRCPSKYEMREREENGEEMPHAAPSETS